MRDKFFAQKYPQRLYLIIREAVIILTESYLDWPSEKQRRCVIFDVFVDFFHPPTKRHDLSFACVNDDSRAQACEMLSQGPPARANNLDRRVIKSRFYGEKIRRLIRCDVYAPVHTPPRFREREREREATSPYIYYTTCFPCAAVVIVVAVAVDGASRTTADTNR